MVEKDGLSYLQPVSEKETPQINNLKKWEQAFEVYATIYSKKNPSRASELFKHIYNIRAAAATYV